MVALRAQGKALRVIAQALAAKGHKLSHEGVAAAEGRREGVDSMSLCKASVVAILAAVCSATSRCREGC